MDRPTLDLLASYAKLKRDASSIALHDEKILLIEKFTTANEPIKKIKKKPLTIAQ